MSRRAVGLAAAQLLAEEAGKYPTVLSRVLELAARRRIAPEIADWAHHLQLEESAACDASTPCTGATAQGLLDFSDMFLMCAYTLPEQIAERRRRVDALVAQPAIA
jgi:hypothetical protein